MRHEQRRREGVRAAWAAEHDGRRLGCRRDRRGEVLARRHGVGDDLVERDARGLQRLARFRTAVFRTQPQHARGTALARGDRLAQRAPAAHDPGHGQVCGDLEALRARRLGGGHADARGDVAATGALRQRRDGMHAGEHDELVRARGERTGTGLRVVGRAALAPG